MSDGIEDHAAVMARDIIAYFKNLEALGDFAGEQVDEQKQGFLMMALINFARRESWPLSSKVSSLTGGGK